MKSSEIPKGRSLLPELKDRKKKKKEKEEEKQKQQKHRMVLRIQNNIQT